MDKKGLSVVELIVSFVLCILVFIFIIQIVSSIEELYINLGIKTNLLNKQSLIAEDINNKFYNTKTLLIKKCDTDCFTFFYKDNTSEKMFIDKESNTFHFGENTYSFQNLGFVDGLTITLTPSSNYDESILTVNLNIKNSIFDSGKYVIKAIYQFSSNETVYSANNLDGAEIFLLGPAVSYKFSEDLFIEPGWMVYYPDGTITINKNDVTPSSLEYDQDGNGYIIYTGNGAAAGQTKKRVIKNYETAKDHILDLYKNSPTSGITFYDTIGKHVYKGENPNNYILIGTNMFRIISMDLQEKYVLNDQNEEVKENKYLLKVVSEDILADNEGNTRLPFGNARDNGPLDNMSVWMKKKCNNGECVIYKQEINRIVNEEWLAKLLNTGTGKLQIVNGTFNMGLVNWNSYNIGPNDQPKEAITNYPIKQIYDDERSDVELYEDRDEGTWHGNCLENICGPNAGILSLTDVLFAGPKCIDNVVVEYNGSVDVKCAENNWLWPQLDGMQLRLMTRDNITNTWVLTDRSFFIASNVYGEFETKATIYLDADLYITGTGTKENPYSLYSIIK